MKKTFAFIGAALMAMSLAVACGGKSKNEPTTPAVTGGGSEGGGGAEYGNPCNPCGDNPCGNPCGGW